MVSTMKMRDLLPVLLVLSLGLQLAQAQRNKGKADREGKQSDGRTTVVSCRVFRQGVCKKTSRNIITVNKSITNSRNCQQFCYSTPGCAAFTHFEQTRDQTRKCVLFKDCNGKLGSCKDCISGPIMPRINECLAAKQEVAPAAGKPPCKFGCTGVCLGPRCPELLNGIAGNSTKDTQTQLEGVPTDLGSTDAASVGAEGGTNEQGGSAEEATYDEYETEVEIDDTFFDEEPEDEYADYDDYVEDDFFAEAGDEEADVVTNYDDEYDYNEEDFETEIMDDEPLEEEAVVEEEDEIADEDINIDAGFLNDEQGNTVELPEIDTRTTTVKSTQSAAYGPTFIFYFCALGGTNENGPVSAVDILSNGIAGALQQALSIAPMPSKVTQGGECSAAYTGQSITSCSSGYSILSPYGYLYKPGSCYDYNLYNKDWKETGAKLTSYRKGGTITKLGRYLMATGGKRGKRSLRSIELFDPKKPQKGWRKMSRLTMPTSVAQHCTVTLKGRNGKEVIITGGKGRENKALKLDVTTNKWYSLNRLSQGRRKHACVKATLNGRTGVVVSGGIGRDGRNMTSVEFYDTAAGAWYTLPNLRKARLDHAMVVNKGKLMVAGGVGAGRKGKEYLDDIEVFTGRRWVKSEMKLDRPRAGFSLVKIPRKGKSQGSRTTKKSGNRGSGRPTTKSRSQTSKRRKTSQRKPRTG